MPSWAEHKELDGKWRPLAATDGTPPPRGVSVTDMPAPKPQIRKRKIKGLPGLSSTDEDHQPGGGTWYPVTR